MQSRVVGPDHPHTLMSAYNLAMALAMQDKHGEADTLHGSVLSTRRRVLGKLPPVTPVQLGLQRHAGLFSVACATHKCCAGHRCHP